MKNYLKLFRFGEGGDGGGTGSANGDGASTGGETSGEAIPTSIPERGRKAYAEALKMHSTASKVDKTEPESAEETAKESKPSYEELIKSEDYKEAHKQYMDKTISDRLKRYKGQEQKLNDAMALLNTIGTKYGLNAESEDYLSQLKMAVDGDDSYYEKYADEHDMTPAEARKIVTLENKLKEQEASRIRAEQEEAQRQQFETIRANAQQTQAKYPGFDLGTELQNPNFVRILNSCNGDTTAAYVAVHHSEIVKGVAETAAKQAQIASANAIASGARRPTENGLSGTAASDVSINFSKMSLQELRAWADQQRRK